MFGAVSKLKDLFIHYLLPYLVIGRKLFDHNKINQTFEKYTTVLNSNTKYCIGI